MAATQDVQLYSNKKEQELISNLADLFAIIATTERLEKAYVRDAISPNEYEPACEKLIGQFRTLYHSLKDTVPNVEQFMLRHNMQCPLAAARLLRSGLPATVEHRRPRPAAYGVAGAVAETVQNYITAMDALKLNMVAVDQLCPVLNDVLQSMTKLSTLPPDFGPKEKVKEWYTKLYQMPASQELSEAEARQLMFDLDSSYSDFMSTINAHA